MNFSPNNGLRAAGRVKWFDAIKGFGFLEVEGMAEEVLLHVSQLRDFGLASISKNTLLEFDYEISGHGIRVARILDIERAVPGITAEMLSAEDRQNLQPAAVKWFDATRRFGFVTLFRTNKDVFIHLDVIETSEVQDVFPGLAVAVSIETEGKKVQVKNLFNWASAGL